ncbi:MAG: hypothetical protein B6244_09980 [Candidatus Cloacimonetes bacterium 4572_55]|nr:MAG: hypothetical protein B6244_09980 [Candidatus Cloacimonetes bacterium 4572_55]
MFLFSLAEAPVKAEAPIKGILRYFFIIIISLSIFQHSPIFSQDTSGSGAIEDNDLGSEIDGLDDLDELLDILTEFNVVVNVATKSASTLDESPAIVTVIDRETIERSNAQTLADLIRMTPGLDFSKGSLGWGEPLDGFYGRGVLSTFSQTVLLLLNGKNRFNDFTYASPFMSTRINVDMIERVEIMRGPGSAVYGGNAFSAVINVITRDTDASPETVFEMSGSKSNQASLYVLHKSKIQESDWRVGFQGKYFFDHGKSYPATQKDNLYTNDMLPDADRITDGIDPSFDVSLNISNPDEHVEVQLWYTDHNPHPFLTGLSMRYKKNAVNYIVGCRNLFDADWEMPLMDDGLYSYPYRGREFFVKMAIRID